MGPAEGLGTWVRPFYTHHQRQSQNVKLQFLLSLHIRSI